VFRDRREAGELLAERLERFATTDPIVLGLPRGGVPVAAEVARALRAPLDVLVVRKLGCPWQPELAVGAIGEGGIRIVEDRVVAEVGLDVEELERLAAREERELARRLRRFRGDRPPLDLRGRTVLVVDDGIATGATARAGLEVARRRGATTVVLAVPVAPPATVRELGKVADEVVCLHQPAAFWAVGQFYADFSQTPDAEVARLLAADAHRHEPLP
jgi:putative phosphoribosyl transferase